MRWRWEWKWKRGPSTHARTHGQQCRGLHWSERATNSGGCCRSRRRGRREKKRSIKLENRVLGIRLVCLSTKYYDQTTAARVDGCACWLSPILVGIPNLSVSVRAYEQLLVGVCLFVCDDILANGIRTCSATLAAPSMHLYDRPVTVLPSGTSRIRHP